MAAKKVRTGAESKKLILDTGAKLASKYGGKNVTRRMVAKQAKVAESLVTHYVGASADAQKLYARQARSLGLALPDDAKATAIGKKLRAHKPGDKRDTRVRTTVERKAIVNKAAGKVAAKKSSGSTSARATKTATASPAVQGKPKPAQNKALPGPAQNKSAARAPMPAPIQLPALPAAEGDGIVLPALPL